THRALLRGLSDHQERPKSFGNDAEGVRVAPSCLRKAGIQYTLTSTIPLPAVITGLSAFADDDSPTCLSTSFSSSRSLCEWGCLPRWWGRRPLSPNDPAP